MIEIIEENPVSMSHVKKFLSDNKKKGDLNFRASKTLDYVNNFKTKSISETESLKKSLEELNIPRLKINHIYKILDIMPKNAVELKSVMQNSGLALSNEHIKKIVNTINS